MTLEELYEDASASVIVQYKKVAMVFPSGIAAIGQDVLGHWFVCLQPTSGTLDQVIVLEADFNDIHPIS